MPDGVPSSHKSSEDEELYSKLLQLEQLESLLEELEDGEASATPASATPASAPPEHKSLLNELGLSNAEDVRARIAHLHMTLDEAD